MDEALLEIRDYDGDGYQQLVDYGAWRVAFLRYLDALQPDRIDSMERHTETDEVFVLLNGRGMLIMGGNQAQVGEIAPALAQHELVHLDGLGVTRHAPKLGLQVAGFDVAGGRVIAGIGRLVADVVRDAGQRAVTRVLEYTGELGQHRAQAVRPHVGRDDLALQAGRGEDTQ